MDYWRQVGGTLPAASLVDNFQTVWVDDVLPHTRSSRTLPLLPGQERPASQRKVGVMDSGSGFMGPPEQSYERGTLALPMSTSPLQTLAQGRHCAPIPFRGRTWTKWRTTQ